MADDKKHLTGEEKKEIWSRFREEVRDKGMQILPSIVEKYSNTRLKQISPGQFTGCCPFHSEKTPSFIVSNKGFYCHGSGCEAKGDVFSFLQKYNGMSFREALETVASEVNVPLPDTGASNSQTKWYPSAAERPSADPADEFLAPPERLTPHGISAVPQSLYIPKPGRFVKIFRDKQIDDRTGDVMRESGVRSYKPEMVHQYRNVNNDLLLAVLRLRMKDGRKYFFSLDAKEPLEGTPDDLISSGVSWQIRTGNEGRRPVYGAHALRAWLSESEETRGPIILVEGEKCADYAKRVFKEPGTLILSATGGFNASILADWKEITNLMAEKNVIPKKMIVWPDADPVKTLHDGTTADPQEIYAKRVFSGFLRDLKDSFGVNSDLSSVDFKRVIPPEGVEKGWDVADAIDEGWTRAKIESYIHSAIPVDMSHMKTIVPEILHQKENDRQDAGMQV